MTLHLMTLLLFQTQIFSVLCRSDLQNSPGLNINNYNEMNQIGFIRTIRYYKIILGMLPLLYLSFSNSILFNCFYLLLYHSNYNNTTYQAYIPHSKLR